MSVIFGFQEATAVAALGALVFVQIAQTMMKQRGKKNKYYEDHKPHFAPPNYVFPIVWSILYVALTIGAFYFLQNTVPDTWQYILGFVMFMIHIVFNKLWSVVFWDFKNPSAALGILLGVLIPTGIVWLVASIVNQTGLYYVNVIMLCLMIPWLLFAAALNASFAKKFERHHPKN